MLKQAVLISSKGNLYYSTDFFHLGLKDKFRFNLSIFRQFSLPGDSVGGPFLFNSDGTLPDRVATDLKEEGNQIIYFNTPRDFNNFLSTNKLKVHSAFLDQNDPYRITPYLAWIARPYQAIEDTVGDLWFIEYKHSPIVHHQDLQKTWLTYFFNSFVQARFCALDGRSSDYQPLPFLYTLTLFKAFSIAMQEIYPKRCVKNAYSFLDRQEMFKNLLV